MTMIELQPDTRGPRRPREPAPTFQEFLPRLDLPPRNGAISPRLIGGLPCGCKPSRAARESGRRGLTITESGTVTHTRCGQLLARLVGDQFVSEPMPEPPPRVPTTPPTTRSSRRQRDGDLGVHDPGSRSGCDLG